MATTGSTPATPAATELALPAMRLPKFSATAEATATGIAVTVAGEADLNIVDGLTEFLVGLHQEASRLAAVEVAVDLRKVAFINSSCLRQFATWLARIAKLDAQTRYRVALLLNAEHPWQRRSFEPLQYVAPGFVTVR
jgi:hypothetical protein